jgi:hypothetical protein
MATPQTRQKRPRKTGEGPRRRPAQHAARKPIPLKSEIDEPRPQPPAEEKEDARKGRDDAARSEAAHANGLDDENGRDRSLFDLPETDGSAPKEQKPEPEEDEDPDEVRPSRNLV